MLRFLQWLVVRRPEIDTIEGRSIGELLALADEFEGTGTLRTNKVLARKWETGFHVLLETESDWNGYRNAREFAMSIGRRRGRSQFGKSMGRKRSYDPVERYRDIPLHAVLLYSTEDDMLSSYVSAHWNALDRLSGDLCDIYPSLEQLRGNEYVYDTIGSTPEIAGMDDIRLSELPGIMFWNNLEQSNYVSFRGLNSDSIRHAFRLLFEHIRAKPSIESVALGKEKVSEFVSEQSKPSAGFTQNVYGGNAAQGMDFTQNVGVQPAQLASLVQQLRELTPRLDLEHVDQEAFRQDVEILNDSSADSQTRLSAGQRIKTALIQGGTKVGAAGILAALENVAKMIGG